MFNIVNYRPIFPIHWITPYWKTNNVHYCAILHNIVWLCSTTSENVHYCAILHNIVWLCPKTSNIAIRGPIYSTKVTICPKNVKKRPGTSITPKNVRQCPLTYNWIRISIGGRLNMQLMIARWSLELMMSFIFII